MTPWKHLQTEQRNIKIFFTKLCAETFRKKEVFFKIDVFSVGDDTTHLNFMKGYKWFSDFEKTRWEEIVVREVEINQWELSES